MKHLNKYKVFETLNSRGSKSLTESEVREIVNVNCKFWLNEDKSHKELGDTLFRSQRIWVHLFLLMQEELIELLLKM